MYTPSFIITRSAVPPAITLASSSAARIWLASSSDAGSIRLNRRMAMNPTAYNPMMCRL